VFSQIQEKHPYFPFTLRNFGTPQRNFSVSDPQFLATGEDAAKYKMGIKVHISLSLLSLFCSLSSALSLSLSLSLFVCVCVYINLLMDAQRDSQRNAWSMVF